MNTRTAVGLAFVASVILIGCATFETNAYRSLGITAHTVDVLMTTWADASVATNTTPALDLQVMSAHLHYRQAMALAKISIDAYRGGTNTQSAVNFALQAVASSKEDLRKLILMLVLPQNQRTEIQTLP